MPRYADCGDRGPLIVGRLQYWLCSVLRVTILPCQKSRAPLEMMHSPVVCPVAVSEERCHNTDIPLVRDDSRQNAESRREAVGLRTTIVFKPNPERRAVFVHLNPTATASHIYILSGIFSYDLSTYLVLGCRIKSLKEIGGELLQTIILDMPFPPRGFTFSESLVGALRGADDNYSLVLLIPTTPYYLSV